jgi:hypothetical protein|tara:strand:- start:299 stop:934 length:636 start_codon:yes stop_codon:yes gene_type:complete
MGFLVNSFIEFPVESDVYFEDDFTSNKWTYSGDDMSFDASNDRMNFSIAASSTDYAYVNIPATFGSVNYFIEYTIYITSVGGSGNTGGIAIGSSTSQASNTDYYIIEFASDSTKYTFPIANEVYAGSPYYAWATGTNYFVKMTVNVSTRATVFKLYPTADDRTNDTNALLTKTVTPSANITDSDFLRVGNVRPTNGFTLVGYLKDFLVSKS